MSNQQVVLYRYNGSPFATKIQDVLAIKGIPYKTVDVSMILPRPEVIDILGVNYRRIPVLAIGNDVYCDTSLISTALERRFPAKEGYGTIFPPRKGSKAGDSGLQMLFTIAYTDRFLFGLTSSTISFDKFPAAFIKDRSSFSGNKLDAQAILARQPRIHSKLVAHLSLMERQLSDGREFLLETGSPSLTDIAIHFNFSWIFQNKGMDTVLDASRFPNFIKFCTRMESYIKEKKASGKSTVERIDGKSAAKLITQGGAEAENVVGFDTFHGQLLNVKLGNNVTVTPEDVGATHSVVGKLVGLNNEEVVVQVTNSQGSVRVHLPMIGFSISSKPVAKL